VKEKARQDETDSWGNFTGLARRFFAVPKHELDEEITKEKAEGKAENPPRTASKPKTKKAA